MRLRVELFLRLAALFVLRELCLYFDWLFQLLVGVAVAGWLLEGLLRLIGLVGLQAVGLAVLLVLPVVRLFGLRLLLRVISLGPAVLGRPFLVAAFDLFLPVQVEQLVVVNGGREYLLGLTLEYPVAEFLLLQLHQLLQLLLQLGLLYAHLLFVQPLQKRNGIWLPQQQ